MPLSLRDDLASSSPGLRLRLQVRQECTLRASKKMSSQHRHANGQEGYPNEWMTTRDKVMVALIGM